MKVLVIGGNGFIGSHVVRRLLDEGHGVRCTLRATSRTDRIEGLDFERATGDVTDAGSIARNLEDCDAVVHLASPSSWQDINSPKLDEIVIDGTRNVLRAAEPRGKRVVFCSSVTALGGAREPTVLDESTDAVPGEELRYARAKREAEQLCRDAAERGTDVCIVSPAEVYGPGDHDLVTAGNLVDFAKSNPVLVCNGGTGVVHVDDVAEGTVRALTYGRSGERYILSGDNLTIRELAELTLRLLGKRAPIVTVPNPVLKGITRAATALRIPLPFEPATIPYATLYWLADNRKAREELGVEFRDAEQTLAPTLEWLRESGHIA